MEILINVIFTQRIYDCAQEYLYGQTIFDVICSNVNGKYK